MLELLKTLYVFQSLDLALFFFLRGRDVLVVVWPGVGDGDGDGIGGRGGGESYQTLDCFCVPPLAPPICQNGLLPAKHAFTAREGLFFVDEKDTPPGLKRNPSIHKVV